MSETRARRVYLALPALGIACAVRHQPVLDGRGAEAWEAWALGAAAATSTRYATMRSMRIWNVLRTSWWCWYMLIPWPDHIGPVYMTRDNLIASPAITPPPGLKRVATISVPNHAVWTLWGSAYLTIFWIFLVLAKGSTLRLCRL